MNKNFINWISYHNQKLVNEYNLKKTENIKLFNTSDTNLLNDNINHLHEYLNEFCLIYYIWKNNLKSDYISISHYRRNFIDIDFNELDKNKLQVYLLWTNDCGTAIDYCFDEHLDPIGFYKQKMIEYLDIQNIYDKNIVNKIKYSTPIQRMACGVFACKWEIFVQISSFIFGYFDYIFPNDSWKNIDILQDEINHQYELYLKDHKKNETWEMFESKRYFAWMIEHIFSHIIPIIYELFSIYNSINYNILSYSSNIEDITKFYFKNVNINTDKIYIVTNINSYKDICKAFENDYIFPKIKILSEDENIPSENILKLNIKSYIDLDNFSVKQLTLDNYKQYVKYDIKTAVVCCGRLENRYAVEFVEHYKKLGFDHIFIADNNRDDEEHFEDVLQQYIDDKFVTIFDYRNVGGIQIFGYVEMYNRISLNYNYDWLLFCDFDEYLTLTEDNNIKKYLSRDCFKNANQIFINWKIYTDNNLIYDDGRTCQERFTEEYIYQDGIYWNENQCIKPIIRTKIKDIYQENLHFFMDKNNILNDSTCNNKGENYELASIQPTINYDYAYIKHFLTKTIEEYVMNKSIRGTGDMPVEEFDERYGIKRFFIYNKKTKEKLDYIDKYYNKVIKYIHINKSISLGGLCEGYLFGEKFGSRIQGPIDNIAGYTFKSVLDIFDNSVFNNILSDNIIELKKNPFWKPNNGIDDDEYMRCYNNWMSPHIDFTIPKRKEDFKIRINNFKEFENQLGENDYYFYALGEYEESLTDEDLQYTINHLPLEVLNKLIVIYGYRHYNVAEKFKKYFRTIFYNINLGWPIKSIDSKYWFMHNIYKLTIISNNEDDYQICNILRPKSSIFVSDMIINSLQDITNINNNEPENDESLIYILSDNDFNINDEQLENIVNNVDDNIKQKIIIISKYKEIPNLLMQHFRCIQFNIDKQNKTTYELWKLL